jgi:hypothetical protein
MATWENTGRGPGRSGPPGEHPRPRRERENPARRRRPRLRRGPGQHDGQEVQKREVAGEHQPPLETDGPEAGGGHAGRPEIEERDREFDDVVPEDFEAVKPVGQAVRDPREGIGDRLGLVAVIQIQCPVS